ncbi:ROK family transcriptional regulator [Lacisediminihabitans profunda]|uniref:ROK family transcriptional regulator n=1 Tax=Lacisediminihabitans profunda TaxID=2594790 RepID=A0A5C8UTK4_9MICO|nr:ROK family transcriptional regulator [Lacisediminihabitans profunda]
MVSGSPSVLRALNDRSALEILLRESEVSRAQLETMTGLSKPATSQLLNRLEAVGLVKRVGLRDGGPGPRAQLWSLNAEAAYVAGIDVTATEIDVSIADLQGATVSHLTTPVIPGRGEAADALFGTVSEACALIDLNPSDLAHVTIGMPGAVDPVSGQLRYASDLPDWAGIDILRTLSDHLAVPVTVENDVNLVALNEMATGTALGATDFVLLWLSDRGVGSSVVLRGELLRGSTLGAGEIGFMPVPDLARATTPSTGFRYGDRLAQPAVLALAKAYGISAPTGTNAVTQALADKHSSTPGFLDDLARRIAAGLAGVVALIDPELIVLGGDVGLAGGEVLCNLIASSLAELVQQRVTIRPGQTDRGSVGAGAVQSAVIPARERYFAAGSTLDLPSA